jgi:hypothetical protein
LLLETERLIDSRHVRLKRVKRRGARKLTHLNGPYARAGANVENPLGFPERSLI